MFFKGSHYWIGLFIKAPCPLLDVAAAILPIARGIASSSVSEDMWQEEP
jgi:hypothetical protein